MLTVPILLDSVNKNPYSIFSRGQHYIDWRTPPFRSSGVKENGNTLALRFLAVQVAISIATSVLFAVIFSTEIAVAAIVGSAINVVATTYFALVALGLSKASTSKAPKPGSVLNRDSGELKPGAVLARFYIGEVGKFIVIAVCFTVVYRHFPELVHGYNAVALFAAFLIAQTAYVVAPFILKDSF